MDLRLCLKKTYSSNITIHGGRVWFPLHEILKSKGNSEIIASSPRSQYRNEHPKVTVTQTWPGSPSFPPLLYDSKSWWNQHFRHRAQKSTSIQHHFSYVVFVSTKKRYSVSLGSQRTLTFSFSQLFNPAQEPPTADICALTSFVQDNPTTLYGNHWALMEAVLHLKNPSY